MVPIDKIGSSWSNHQEIVARYVTIRITMHKMK
jgi:inner membrane protein involved in colicin E2 resistance